jgi:selenocysteine-specific elongation factor
MDGPDGAAELARRGAVRAAALRAMGVPEPPAALRAAGWLVDPGQADRWRAGLVRAVAEHAAAHPLEHGLPVETARQRLGLPDARLVPALLTDRPATPGRPADPAAPAAPAGSGVGAGLVVRDGRVTVAAAPAVPAELRAALDALRADLAAAPYAAPEAHRLAGLGLGRRELAAAVRAGALLRVADGVYLLPGADDRAAAALAELPQPFTLSEARRALGTSRRVAVPLLELLDGRGRTERLPDDRRRVRPGHG